MVNLQIIVGSSQGTLFALNFNKETSELEKCFTCRDHAGKIRDISISNQGSVFTVGEDENVQVYNFSKKKSIGTILSQKSFTNKMCLSKDYIVLAQQSGQVSIIGQKDFEVYHDLQVSKHPLSFCDLHPSGIFLLTLSNLNRFSIWDLSTCQAMFNLKIKVRIQQARFLGMDSIVFIGRNEIYIFNIKTQQLENSIQFERNERITCSYVFQKEDQFYLAVCFENGILRIYGKDQLEQLQEDEEASFVIQFKMINHRPTGIKVVYPFLVGISSEGEIVIYDIEETLQPGIVDLSLEKYEPVHEFSLSTRLVHLDFNLAQQ